MMRALIEHARALSRYRRLGFEAVQRIGNAWTMRLDLA
jgi:hypothetical protein